MNVLPSVVSMLHGLTLGHSSNHNYQGPRGDFPDHQSSPQAILSHGCRVVLDCELIPPVSKDEW